MLIEFRLEFVTQGRYVFSHTWDVGDVLVWEQRAVLHRAMSWKPGAPQNLTSLGTPATFADGPGKVGHPAPVLVH